MPFFMIKLFLASITLSHLKFFSIGSSTENVCSGNQIQSLFFFLAQTRFFFSFLLKNSLIDDGQAETFDFAFIDADKSGYDSYYELCLQLLKSGGVIAFDNTLWSEKVLKPPEDCDEDTLALKRLNDKLAKDHGRAYVVQLNVGDGYTIAVKL